MADTNAKTIQDLTQTTAVSGDDLVVVAQSGSNEATKATVSTLAEAVGELNSTGALSELSLATSIGKNLLAQNLTNKGVPTDPSETLVAMADKVGNLQVDTGMDLLTGPIGYKQVSLSMPSAYSTYAFHILQNGDKIFWSNKKLYYIPEGDYDTFDEFIASATSEVDCDWPKQNCLCFDKNDEYCVLFMGNKTFNIYQVNSEQKTITLYKTLTVENTPNYDSFGGLGILSGARFIMYTVQDPENTSYGRAVAINVETGAATLSPLMENHSYSYDWDTGFLWEQSADSGKLYLKNYSYSYAIMVNWKIEGSNFIWGTIDDATTWESTVVWIPRMQMGVRVEQQSLATNSANFNYNKIRVSVYSPLMVRLAYVDIPMIPAYNGSYANIGFCRNTSVRAYQRDGLWKIEILPFLPTCTFNPTTNELIYDGQDNYIPVDNQDYMYYDHYPALWCLFSNKVSRSASGYYDSTSSRIFWPELPHRNLITTYYTTTDKLTGFRRTGSDGSVYIYPINKIDESTAKSSAMNVTTTTVPLPEDTTN